MTLRQDVFSTRLTLLLQVQRTIREEMADSLVLTIAHRLKTVLGKYLAWFAYRYLGQQLLLSDYDRILVLGNGHILEFDTPATLFAKEGGVFREMCKHSADWEELKATIHRST